MFDLVSRFEVNHYFESGHGKSACDVDGGATKGNADNAVKQEKTVIQDAMDLFAYAIQSEGEIEYQLITTDEYEMSNAVIEERKAVIKSVKGKMTLHAISTDNHRNLKKRNTTCACWNCFNSGDGFHGISVCGWDTVDLLKQTEHPVHDTYIEVDDSNATPVQNEEIAGSKSDYVVATYDRICYIVKVLEEDVSDKTLHIDFMVGSGKVVKRFRWPNKQDTLWINNEDILRTIQHPTATGKRGLLFRISDDVMEFIEAYNSN